MSQKTSTIYPIEALNTNNPQFEEKRKQNFDFFKAKIPSEGELRYLGNRHHDCRYYTLGLELCKQRILQTKNSSFLPCKDVVENMYSCYTDDNYGKNFLAGPEEIVPHMKKFLDCYFTKNTTLTDCMVNVEDGVRAVYRKDASKFADYY